MCVDIGFRGECISNAGELRKASGLTVLPMFGGLTRQPDDNLCLCGVDVEAVARHMGVYCDPDTFGYVFSEPDDGRGK